MIPQSPARRGAPLRNKTESPALSGARERLFARWQRAPRGPPRCTPRRRAARSNSPAELPFLAPHFVAALLAAGSGEAELRSTLDVASQRLLERQLQRYVAGAERVGIHNAAAMLVDSRDMEVKALVGSANFFDAAISGQVNGTAAKRSPGSTLKPFVYALGLEQGVIHPLSVLRDVPMSFSAYTPENFDGRFVAPVTARDALVRSRNIPRCSSRRSSANPTYTRCCAKPACRAWQTKHTTASGWPWAAPE